MSRTRLNVFLQREHAISLDELAAIRRVSKSSLIAAALATFLNPESTEPNRTAVARRLEKLDTQLDRLDRDQTILTEAFALYLRHHFSITPPLPEEHQRAARARGKERFEQFVQQLGRHIQRGGSLSRDLTA